MAFFPDRFKRLSGWVLLFPTLWVNSAFPGARKGMVLANSGGTCSASVDSLVTTPNPVRKIEVKPFQAKAFHLPNGASIDITADLQSIEMTALTSTQGFAPTDSAAPDLCDTHLELRAAMTVFQLDVADLGITFGCTSQGELGPITGINNKDTVQVGTIAMDFSIWRCTAGKCMAIVASTASHSTANVQMDLDIDFSSVKLGPNFVYNTPLGGIFRAIMVDGLRQLDQSVNRLSELPWQARVREYNPAIGLLVFDAGAQQRLAPNQAFEIYAPLDTTPAGMCNVYQAVAYIHTTSVNAVSSIATVDQILDNRGIQNGDVVMIRTVGGRR